MKKAGSEDPAVGQETGQRMPANPGSRADGQPENTKLRG